MSSKRAIKLLEDIEDAALDLATISEMRHEDRQHLEDVVREFKEVAGGLPLEEGDLHELYDLCDAMEGFPHGTDHPELLEREIDELREDGDPERRGLKWRRCAGVAQSVEQLFRNQ